VVAESKAHVLTLLPERVFQVFQVVGGRGVRENGDCIYNLSRSVILVCVYAQVLPTIRT